MIAIWPGRTAEADEAQLQPEAKRVPEADRRGRAIDQGPHPRDRVRTRAHAEASFWNATSSPSNTPAAASTSWSSSVIAVAHASEHTLDTSSFGRDHATGIERVHQHPEAQQRRRLQVEAGQQGFEGDHRAAVRERSAVEVETDRALGAIGR